jgi:hypothetical protein
MKIIRLSALIPVAATAVIYVAATALNASGESAADFTTLEGIQSAANARPGPRTVPGGSIPVPNTASPEFQAMIAAPYRAVGVPGRRLSDGENGPYARAIETPSGN